MKCPNCGAPADFKTPRCAGCGIVFQEWYEARAWGPKKDKERPRARQKASASLPPLLWAAVALGLAAAAGAWSWSSHSGQPLPPRAYWDRDAGFAFSPPSGWEFETRDKERGEWKLAVRLSREAAVIEVLVGPDGAGPSPALVEDQFNGGQVSSDSSQELAVDGLSAVRLDLSGGRAFLLSPNRDRTASSLGAPAPKYESVDFKAALILVPGSGRTYLIKFLSEREDFARRKPLWDSFLASFRVVARPVFGGRPR